MPTPIFNNFDFSSPHRPTVSSPLSSSPLRPSQYSPPPLSARDPNTLPRRDVQSSPIKGPSSKFFKYASRNARPNPLRQNRENAQDGRRKLFLKNVRQRADDNKWDRRGGDQETLKLEWAVLDRRRRQQRESDLDGIVCEDEIEDIPELPPQVPQEPDDDVMVDAIAQEEEREMEAMLSMLEAESSSQASARPNSPSLSDDDDYDSLFMDLVSQEESGSQYCVSSGQMDIS
ncbi:Uu.00g096340.m01.CDS01 [Anthostomella pinea]|uniref:Uu.00g096340.m01.CDS01 n=1 Tax=Anthostomella pinea TaxID=933095 RepID=A0AAI8VD71_9PEZI|nr:Uu.00g096340.m01.CDS01 [Anthostomella pinea]